MSTREYKLKNGVTGMPGRRAEHGVHVCCQMQPDIDVANQLVRVLMNTNPTWSVARCALRAQIEAMKGCT